KRRVGMAGARPHVVRNAASHERLGIRQFGSNRGRGDETVSQVLLVLGPLGRANRAARMTAARLGTEVRSIQVNTEQTRLPPQRPSRSRLATNARPVRPASGEHGEKLFV